MVPPVKHNQAKAWHAEDDTTGAGLLGELLQGEDEKKTRLQTEAGELLLRYPSKEKILCETTNLKADCVEEAKAAGLRANRPCLRGGEELVTAAATGHEGGRLQAGHPLHRGAARGRRMAHLASLAGNAGEVGEGGVAEGGPHPQIAGRRKEGLLQETGLCKGKENRDIGLEEWGGQVSGERAAEDNRPEESQGR